MKEKIAILGATGFLGSNIIRLFQQKNLDILACSQHGGIIDNLKIDKVDLTDYIELNNWIVNESITTLLYLSSKVPASFLSTNRELFEINMSMHKNILDIWTRHKFHLVYSSSCSVYLPNSPLPWREDSGTFPDNYYTLSKLMGELLFCKEHSSSKIPLSILRINAPYAIDNPRKTVINFFIEHALNGEDLMLFGDGSREQDYIYIKDISSAFWCAYTQRKSGIYNIASGETVTMKELAEKIIYLTNSESKIVFSDKPDHFQDQKVAIDISKSRKILGFSPCYSLDEGLRDCIDQYRKKKFQG